MIGTAHFQKKWPPKPLRDKHPKNNSNGTIKLDKAEFNDLYWMVDEHETLLLRWLDNLFVFVVSIVHAVESIIERVRRIPRKTETN